MILIGWLRRPVFLGAKFDECTACHEAGPHLLVRHTYWFTIFLVPVVLLWIRHGLVCARCGHEEGVGFLEGLRAIRRGRLHVDRPRPLFRSIQEAERAQTPADWAAFGLDPDASEAAISARWRDLAKELHPDAGGDPAAFVRMNEIRGQLLSAKSESTDPVPAADDVFDPFIPNPKRGFFDVYTKAWAALAVAVLVLGSIGSFTKPTVAGGGTTGSGGGTIPATLQNGHQCWSTGTTLNGCMSASGSYMLFGTATGVRVTCYFAEPFPDGRTVQCR